MTFMRQRQSISRFVTDFYRIEMYIFRYSAKKSNLKPFKVVSSPGKGRYAVATSDLEPGTVVLQVNLFSIMCPRNNRIQSVLNTRTGGACDVLSTS